MKVLAQRGDSPFLVAVDEMVDGMHAGRVVDISHDPPKVYPVQVVGAIAKFGYWETDITNTAGAAQAAAAVQREMSRPSANQPGGGDNGTMPNPPVPGR